MKLAVALFAVGAICRNVTPEDKDNVKRVLARIQAQMENINYKDPPYADIGQIEEPTCLSWLYDCRQTNFKIRQQLVDKQLSQDDRHLVDSKPKVTVYHRAVVEQDLENHFDDAVQMSLEVSHSVWDSTTKGWHIGAHYSATASVGAGPVGANGGWGINGGYSDSWSEGKSDSKALSVSGWCKSGYNCRIETWTFHVKISGYCELRPSINCGREMDPCARDWSETCSQFESYRTRKCILHDGAASRYPRGDCEVVTPINRDSGGVLSKVMLIMDRMDTTETATASATPVAIDPPIGAETTAVAVDYLYGLYKLNTGEWYDADREEKPYMAMVNENVRWHDKPGEPKPNITEVASWPTYAIEERGNGLYWLNNCEWYDATAETNPYFDAGKKDNGNDGWYSKPNSPKPDVSSIGENTKCEPYKTDEGKARKLRKRRERPEKDKIVSTAEHLAKRWQERPEMVVVILA